MLFHPVSRTVTTRRVDSHNASSNETVIRAFHRHLDLDRPMTTNKQLILDSVRALVTKVRNLTPADATSAEKLFDFRRATGWTFILTIRWQT